MPDETTVNWRGKIEAADLSWDVSREGIEGGKVKATVTHLPTNLTGESSELGSELRAKDAAMRQLRARLAEHYGSDAEDDEVERIWEDFWKPILVDEGKVDVEAVKRELYDYYGQLQRLPLIFDAVTGGRITKPNTSADAVIATFNEYVTEYAQQYVRGGLDEGWLAKGPEWSTTEEAEHARAKRS